MKKLLFFIAIISLVVGCKDCPDPCANTNPASPTTRESAPTCLGLGSYRTLTSLQDKVDWLSTNGKYVCTDTLYKHAEATHKIPTGVTVSATAGSSLTISWGQLESFTQNFVYDAYLAFDKSGNNITNIKLIPAYNRNTVCYSIPLLRAIASKHSFTSTSTFEFYNANVGGVQTIAIKGKKGSTTTAQNYDYSDDPSKKKIEKAL